MSNNHDAANPLQLQNYIQGASSKAPFILNTGGIGGTWPFFVPLPQYYYSYGKKTKSRGKNKTKSRDKNKTKRLYNTKKYIRVRRNSKRSKRSFKKR